MGYLAILNRKPEHSFQTGEEAADWLSRQFNLAIATGRLPMVKIVHNGIDVTKDFFHVEIHGCKKIIEIPWTSPDTNLCQFS